jgi:hypothetical protein
VKFLHSHARFFEYLCNLARPITFVGLRHLGTKRNFKIEAEMVRSELKIQIMTRSEGLLPCIRVEDPRSGSATYRNASWTGGTSQAKHLSSHQVFQEPRPQVVYITDVDHGPYGFGDLFRSPGVGGGTSLNPLSLCRLPVKPPRWTEITEWIRFRVETTGKTRPRPAFGGGDGTVQKLEIRVCAFLNPVRADGKYFQSG